MSRDEVDATVAQALEVAQAFRHACSANGHQEHPRRPLVSHHDPTVRFTNSTISVFKQLLFKGDVAERWFLLQPALRLRNLDHFKRTGQMSPFGCYFIALGTVVPPDDDELALRTACQFLLDEIGIEKGRLVLRVSSLDGDFLKLAKATGLRVEIDGYDQRRYRHAFGDPGLGGKNFNFAVEVGGQLVDVGNQIVIAHDGVPRGIEIAFGINNLVACRDQLPHMLDATPGIIAMEAGCRSRMEADAMVSAVALALDGLQPVARGRGGRLREFLRIIAVAPLSPEVRSDILRRLLDAEVRIRTALSPHEDGFADLPAPQALALLEDGIDRVRVDMSQS